MRTFDTTTFGRGGTLRGPGWQGDHALTLSGVPFPPSVGRPEGAELCFGPFALGELAVERRVRREADHLRFRERVTNRTDHEIVLDLELVGASLGAVEAAEQSALGTPEDRWVLTDGVGIVLGGGPRSAGEFRVAAQGGLPRGGERRYRFGWRLRLPPGGSASVTHLLAPGVDAARTAALSAAFDADPEERLNR